MGGNSFYQLTLLHKKKEPAMEIAGLCLPLKPQKEIVKC
jgi:hypothetical protein